MTQPHLDDEQLSADLDGFGLDERGRVHLAGCATCAGRRSDLATVSTAVASPVVPLDAAVVDALVAKAAAGAAPAGEGQAGAVIALAGRPRPRHRLAGPPPGWVAGVAAALMILAGLATFVQTSSRSGDPTNAFGGASDGAAPASPSAEAGAGPSAASMSDPAVVAGDLGDQEDPAALVVALSGSAGPETLAAARPTRDAAAPAAAAGEPAAKVGQDRALCLPAARGIGAGRLGGHLSTSTLRWKGRPAEVLVFEVTEPAGGVTRQALVLSRPGCDLLADPRF